MNEFEYCKRREKAKALELASAYAFWGGILMFGAGFSHALETREIGTAELGLMVMGAFAVLFLNSALLRKARENGLDTLWEDQQAWMRGKRSGGIDVHRYSEPDAAASSTEILHDAEQPNEAAHPRESGHI